MYKIWVNVVLFNYKTLFEDIFWHFGSISNKIVYCGETRIINTVSNLYPADEKAKMEQVACVILAESHTIHNVFL